MLYCSYIVVLQIATIGYMYYIAGKIELLNLAVYLKNAHH